MKIAKKFSFLIAALALTTLGTCEFAYAQTDNLKVAVVNIQEVLQSSSRVSELSKKLENQFKDRQAKINVQQKSFQDQLDKFKKESPTMSQKDRDEMQKKITADRTELLKQVVSYQQDLQKAQNNIMQNINAELNGIVSTIAKDQNYNLVLEAQSVVYAAQKKDISKEVAKKFNTK